MLHQTVRAAGYPRVSDPGLKDSKTLESQADEIIKYCQKKHYDLDSHHLYPEAHTAYLVSYRERPQLRELLQAAKHGEFDVVVVNEFSRLSRRQIEQAVIIDILEGYGVKVESVTEVFEDSAIGRFMRSEYALLSEIERGKIVERCTRGKRKRAESGNLLGQGKPSYGYAWVDNSAYNHAAYKINDIVFYVDPFGNEWSEAKVVDFIFTSADAGMSLRKIRHALTKFGIPTRYNKIVWTATTVHQILRNENYIGQAQAYKWRKQDGKNYMVEREESERIDLPDGTIPPLVSRDLFDRVQQRLIWNKEHATRNNQEPFELMRTGLARCGICKRAMRVQRQKSQSDQYRCHKSTGVAEDDHIVTISVPLLDDAAWEFAKERIATLSIVKARIAELRSQNISPEDALMIEGKLEAVRVKMTNLVKMGMIAEEEDVLQSIQQQLHLLEQEKKGYQTMLADVAEDEDTALTIENEIRKFEEWIENARPMLLDPCYTPTYEEKRLACLILGVRATVWPVGADHRFKLYVAPPNVESLLCHGIGQT